MKPIAALVLASTLVLASCSKDEPTTPNTPTPVTTSSLTATIDGAPWVGTGVVAVAAGGVRQITGGSSTISSGYQLTVQLRNTEVGTYNVSLASNWFSIVRYADGTTPDAQFSTEGTVSVTEKTAEKIVGTFQGKVGTYTVTNGAFTIKL